MSAMESTPVYDPRYLAGIVFFNRRDYFEAHEVWEDLWADTPGSDRRFYQGLIQAAVALYHLGNGNLRGTRKLFLSGREYMMRFDSPFRGLDINDFWRRMETPCAVALAENAPHRLANPDLSQAPTITLDPPPESWPEPEAFVVQD